MSVTVHTVNFPIVTMVFTGKVTDQDIAQAGLQILGLLAKKQAFTLISDMTTSSPSTAQGQALNNLLDKRRDDFRKYMIGNCVVVENVIIRAALRVSLLAVKPPFPVAIETSMMLAELWCKGQLQPLTKTAAR